MSEHVRNDDGDHPLRIETAALDRAGVRRRVLFDESVARRAYGTSDVTRAGVLRSPDEWAAAAVQFLTGTAQRTPDDEAPEIEVR